MTISLDSLKIFCDVVKQRSFSKGAQVNQITQSAASQAISQIEKRLGTQLLDRSKRPFALTPEGKVYYEGCRDLLSQYAAIESRTKSLFQESIGSVSVSSIYSVGLYDLHRYVRQFRELYPQGDVQIQFLHPRRIYESILAEETDLGLISYPRHLRELQIIPWREERMVLVCHPEHRFARLEEIHAEQLRGENFVALDPDIDARRQLDRYLREHAAPVRVVMEFDNLEAIKRGVETSAGVSILPYPTVVQEQNTGSLAIVPLAGEPFYRTLSIIHRKSKPLTPAMRSFIELLKADEGIQPPQYSASSRPLPEKVL